MQNNTSVRITTDKSPVVCANKTVVWEIGSLSTIESTHDIEVDFGWPENKRRQFLGNRPMHQSLKLKKSLFSANSFELYAHLHPATNSQVKFTLSVSSCSRSRKQTVFDSVIEVSPHGSTPDISVRPLDLGSVGQAIRREDRMRLEVNAVLLSETTESRRTIQQPGPTLAKSIGACLENDDLKELSDVELVASDDTSHAAHRLLLSIRSPVFRAMFRHDMQESRTGRCAIDASSAAVTELLRFIYTDDIKHFVEEDNNLLLEVYGLGCLYDLPRLQKLAEAQLQTMTSIDNVADLLVLSVKHGSPLQESCVSMVKENLSAVMDTEGWMNVAKDKMSMAALFGATEDETETVQERSKKRQRRVRVQS